MHEAHKHLNDGGVNKWKFSRLQDFKNIELGDNEWKRENRLCDFTHAQWTKIVSSTKG